MALTTNDDQVRAAANRILAECPFIVASGPGEFPAEGFDSEDQRANFEATRSAGGVTLKQWKDLTFEEKQDLIAAFEKIRDEEDEDAVLGYAVLMKAIGYPGTERLLTASQYERQSVGAIDVEDFQGYIDAQRETATYLSSKPVNPIITNVDRVDRLRYLLSDEGFSYRVHVNKLTSDEFYYSNDRETFIRGSSNGETPFRPAKVSPMVAAAARGKTDSLNVLIEYGADVNQSDSLGRSPLWWAAVNYQYDSYKLLKEKGATFGNLTKENLTEFLTNFLPEANKETDLVIIQDILSAAKAAGIKLDMDDERIKALMKNPNGAVEQKVFECIRGYREAGDSSKYLLEAIKNGNISDVERLLNTYSDSLNVDALPVVGANGQQSTVSAIEYALKNTKDPAKRKEVIESLLSRNPQPKITQGMLELAKTAAEATAEGSVERDVHARLEAVYKEQNPGAIAKLNQALQTRNFEGIRSAMSELANAPDDIKTVLVKPDNIQRYFESARDYFKGNGENGRPRNRELSKKFEDLYELQRYLVSPSSGVPRNIKFPNDSRRKVETPEDAQFAARSIMEELLQNPDYSDSLTPQDKQALEIMIENSKPKDKVQELRQAIASDKADVVIKALESADEETLKTVAKDPALMASCYKILGNHYKESADENTKKLGAQYAELSKLFDKLAKETDATKKTEVEGKIAEALKNLSGQEMQGLMSAGEKQMVTSLSSTYKAQGDTRGNDGAHGNGIGGKGHGNGIGGGGTGHVPGTTTTTTTTTTPTVLNPVQEGVALAQAKAEEEKTPWYKQEWLWWVLGIALAATLGYFSFRKGGWLNKDDDDKEPVVVNSNTNDNSNSNSNSNTGNESGGTLDNSAQNITSAELNDMIASGGRVSRSSSDRS